MAMTRFPVTTESRSLYALSWSYAQDGKLAVDAGTGIIMDANPAFEALIGLSGNELMGMHVTMLHPENEHERVREEFRKAAGKASRHSGFHIQRKDGHCVPVDIWSSDTLTLEGQQIVIAEFRDITDQKQKEHQLSTQNWALSAYAIAALTLGRNHSSEEILLQSICEAITRNSIYVFAWIAIAEDGPGMKLRVGASAGSAIDYLDGLHLTWSEDEPEGRGPTGVCIRTDAVQILEDAGTSPIFDPWRQRARQFGIRSSVSIPLRIEGSWHGALVVYASRAKAFETVPVEVFQRLVEQIVHGIEAIKHKRLLDAERHHLKLTQQHLTEALSSSVSAMVTAMEMRDPYTAGHESRTAQIVYAIGKEMGWDEGRLQGMRMAAMVHDIGKISIPAEILNKQGRLSAAEYELVKVHAESGYVILKDIPFDFPIAEIVRQHHEKLDGSGYPHGLKGEDILPESKVLAVADIVEAMASPRPYRKALGLKIALEEIEKVAGTLLDGEVVRICAALFREERLIMPGLNW
ncbi:MAG: HD domain-containing phosphohydrolase [Terracidiphilus sp.]